MEDHFGLMPNKILKERIVKLEATNAELLRVLVALQKVIDSAAFESVFILASVHGLEYKGPYVDTGSIKQAIANARNI